MFWIISFGNYKLCAHGHTAPADIGGGTEAVFVRKKISVVIRPYICLFFVIYSYLILPTCSIDDLI